MALDALATVRASIDGLEDIAARVADVATETVTSWSEVGEALRMPRAVSAPGDEEQSPLIRAAFAQGELPELRLRVGVRPRGDLRDGLLLRPSSALPAAPLACAA